MSYSQPRNYLGYLCVRTGTEHLELMATNISLNRRTGLPASTAGQSHENVGLLHNGFATFEPAKTDADIVVVAGDVDVQARGV